MFCTGIFLNKTIKEETPYSQSTTVDLTVYLADGDYVVTCKTEKTHH